MVVGGVAVNLHGLVRATEDLALTRLGEATSYVDLEAEEKVVGTVRVRLATPGTPGTLYRMKKGTVRPIDHAAAAALCVAFGLEEESMPVQKYRDVADMPRVPRVCDSQLADRISALWRRATQMAPPHAASPGEAEQRGMK